MKELTQEVRISDVATRTPLIKPMEPRGETLVPVYGEKGIYVGKTRILKKPVFWRIEKLVNCHLVVLGGSGYGKTTTIETISTRASMEFGANVVVLDFNAEYVMHAEMVGGHVVNLGKDAINILDLGGVSPGIRAKQAESALQPFLDTEKATRQARILRILINEAYLRRGITEDPDTWDKEPPTLKDVTSLLGDAIVDVLAGEKDYGDYSEQFQKAVDMLASSNSMRESAMGLLEKLEVYTTPPHDALSRHSTLHLDELFESGYVVINLYNLPDEKSKHSVAITILQSLVEWMRRKGIVTEEGRDLRLMAVLDEAWKAIDIEDSPVKPLVKEGRKFGVAVTVATQDVADVDSYVTNNAGTLFVMKVQDKERETLERGMKMSQQLSERISQMGRGDALAFMNYKEEPVEPFVMHVDPVFPGKTVKVVFDLPANPLDKIVPDALARYGEARK